MINKRSQGLTFFCCYDAPLSDRVSVECGPSDGNPLLQEWGRWPTNMEARSRFGGRLCSVGGVNNGYFNVRSTVCMTPHAFPPRLHVNIAIGEWSPRCRGWLSVSDVRHSAIFLRALYRTYARVSGKKLNRGDIMAVTAVSRRDWRAHIRGGSGGHPAGPSI